MQILILLSWLFSALMSVVFLTYTFHQRGKGFKLSLRNKGTSSDLAHTRVKKTFDLIFFIYCLSEFIFAIVFWKTGFFQNNVFFPALLIFSNFLGLFASELITAGNHPNFHKFLAAIGILGAYIAGASVIGFLPPGLPDWYKYTFVLLATAVIIDISYSISRFKTIPALHEYVFFGAALVWKVLLLPVLILY